MESVGQEPPDAVGLERFPEPSVEKVTAEAGTTFPAHATVAAVSKAAIFIRTSPGIFNINDLTVAIPS